jgi:hypothetical protein
VYSYPNRLGCYLARYPLKGGIPAP